MAYIGNNLTVQQYSPQVAYFSGNGTATSFTLPSAVVSSAQIIVTVANVIQNPSSAFTVSGTTLTFTSAPPSGTNNIWVEYTSLQTNLIQPAAGTVGTSQLVNGTVVTTADATINGLTVGKGGGSVVGNTVLGYQAGSLNTVDSGVTYIGYQAGYNGYNASGTSGNTAVGYQASYTSCLYSNTSLGYQALYANTSGHNTALGYQALTANTSGSNNTAIGDSALAANTTGLRNIATGFALYQNTTGSYNIALGWQSLYNNTTASNNTAVGYQAGYNSTGGNGTYFGYVAGYNTTGANNCFIGINSGYQVTTGAKNTILGAFQGYNGSLDIRTASNYIVLSDGDGNPQVSIDSNAKMTIGASGFNGGIRMPSTGGTIYIASVTSNSQFQIAYNSTSAGVALGSGATSWSTFSDERLKNVTGIYTTALNDISQIKPVKFTWKNDFENKPQVGVIAQSVQNVVPEAIDSTTYEMGGNTEYLQVRYTELIPLMIASIQELNATVTAQAAEIAALKAKVGV
jgi:hypothetical protein